MKGSLGVVFIRGDMKFQDMIKERIDKAFLDNVTSSVAESQETQPLTVELLSNISNELKRKCNHILIMEQEFLPEDCMGILMLRPEDAKKWRKNQGN